MGVFSECTYISNMENHVSWPDAFVAVGSSFAASVAVIGGIRAWRSAKKTADNANHSEGISAEVAELRTSIARLEEQSASLFKMADESKAAVAALNELIVDSVLHNKRGSGA